VGGAQDALGRCSGEQVEKLRFNTLLGLLPSNDGRAIVHVHKGKPPAGSYQVPRRLSPLSPSSQLGVGANNADRRWGCNRGAGHHANHGEHEPVA